MRMCAGSILARTSSSDFESSCVKQNLHLGLRAQLALTPQLQQSIRLLQMSSLDLHQEIGDLLQQNPLLECEESPLDPVGGEPVHGESALETPTVAVEMGAEAREVLQDLAWGDGGGGGGTGEQDPEDGFEAGFNLKDQAALSLRQHLLDQLALMRLAGPIRQCVQVLIESLDEEGYLSADLDELAALLADAREGAPEDSLEDVRDRLEVALRVLQGLDPLGVGARDLGECLRLQLEALPAVTPWRSHALQLVNAYLPLLAEREYGRLRRALGLSSEAELRAVRDLLATLNPRPGAAYTEVATQFVIPDVIVRKTGLGDKARWQVQLNTEAMPRLRVNALYANILNQEGESPALAAQLQEARWMIRSVQQRFETILKVARALVEHQKGWLEHGDAGLRPLVLREVADQLGLHESTVSRATTQKYMLTPRGVVEFKHLFSNAVATDDGEAASSQAIRVVLRQMIQAEKASQPLSDQALSDALGQQGFRVARRTVAKYREQMHIEPATQRRRIV